MDPIKPSAKTGEGILAYLISAALTFLASSGVITPEQVESLKTLAPEIAAIVIAVLVIRHAYKMWRDHKAAQIEIAKINAGLVPANPPQGK